MREINGEIRSLRTALSEREAELHLCEGFLREEKAQNEKALAEVQWLKDLLEAQMRMPVPCGQCKTVSAIREEVARLKAELATQEKRANDNGQERDEAITAWRKAENALTQAQSDIRAAREVLLEIRDKWVPALNRDALEADKTNCNAQSINYRVVVVLSRLPAQSQEER